MTTARWTILSSKVGIPIGRVSPFVPFGICFRRTGGALYTPDFKRRWRSCRFSPRFSAYSSPVTSSIPAAPSFLQSGTSTWKPQDLSSFRRFPMLVRTCSTTPDRPNAPDQYGTFNVVPASPKNRDSDDEKFRGSIARHSSSLSTLRSAGCPTPTQDSLPAAGQALPCRLTLQDT